jgi:two-component system nitrate/nitrite response regulator NarL
VPAAPRLLVVADDPVARAGLRALAESAGLLVVGEAATADLAPDADEASDALLWSLGADDGVDSLRPVAARVPVLVVLGSEEQAREALAAGARGVLLRDHVEDQLSPAVHAVLAGLVVTPSSLAGIGSPTRPPSAEIVEPLTPRETEVLQLMAAGLTNRRVAERLGISEHTVKFHVNAILGKLAAQTRGEAIAQAARLGLLML